MTIENGSAASGWIGFDQVEIDLSGRRLFVANKEVALEPKAFDVLTLLARHPGRAFGRDEILDAVWGHRHVTPGVLNRVITLLRHALGENAQQHQYLHTLHGVGYRLDAQVRFAAERAHAQTRAPVAVETADSDPTLGDKPIAETPVALAQAESAFDHLETKSNAARANVEAVPAPAIVLQQSAAASRNSAAWQWIAILVAILAAAAWFWSKHYSTSQSLTAVTQPTLVVLPLHPVGNAAKEDVLAEGLSEELITRLSHIDGLRLISSTSAKLAQSAKFGLPELAQKLKVTHALEGSLREDGDQLRIDLRLIEVPGGNTLWAQSYDRSIVNVLALESDIADAVAAKLALGLGPQARPESMHEEDPALFRRMLEARTVLRDLATYPDKNPEAMMRELLAEHPNYAPAHGLHALILTLGLPLDYASRRDEARREAERAIQLDPNLPEAYVALSRCASQVADWERAIAMYQKALQLAPTDSVYRSTYGYMLGGLGYLNEGLHEAQIGVASDPLNFIATFAQARLLDTMGRHDKAKKYIDTVLGFGPEAQPVAAFGRWFNAAWRHDSVDMHAALEVMSANLQDNPWIDSYTAVTAALGNAQRWPQAHAAIEESEQRARAQHFGNPTNFLRLLEPQPDYPLVLAGFDVSLRNNYPSYYLLIWMPEYRAARQAPAFQDFLRRNHILDYWRAHGFPPQCKPDGDGARCD